MKIVSDIFNSRIFRLIFTILPVLLPALSLSFSDSINSVAVFILGFTFLGILPGYVAVALSFPKVGLVETLIVGSVIGICIVGLGNFLSHFTHVYFLRFFPSVFLVLWGLKSYRKILKNSYISTESNWIVIGIVSNLLLGWGVFWETIRSQPIVWTGSWYFENDINYHIALVSSTISNASGVFGFLPSKQITYTWLLHGALATLGSATKLHSDQLVLHFWPSLYFGLVGPLLATASAILFKQKWAIAITPSLFTLYTGPIFFKGTFAEFHWTFPPSPTFELGVLLIVVIVIWIHLSIQNWETVYVDPGKLRLLSLLALIFAAASAKGSIGPLVLGIVTLGLLRSKISSTHLFRHYVYIMIVSIISVVSSLLVVIRTKESLVLGPFSLLNGYVEQPQARMLLAVLVMLGVVCALFAIGYPFENGVTETFLLLLGGIASGLFGVSIFDHDGKSQAYFYFACIPLFIILLVGMATLAASKLNKSLESKLIYSALLFSAWYLGNEFLSRDSNLFLKYWMILGAVIALVTFLSYIFFRNKLLFRSAAILFMCCSGAFSFGSEVPAYSRSEKADYLYSLEDSQINALRYIRTHSALSDVVLTNKYCGSGNIEDGNCNDRVFIAAAYTERKVYYETAAYTFQDKNSVDRQRFIRSQQFYTAPNRNLIQELKSDGVVWIYLDKSIPHSASIYKFADLYFETSTSAVLRLK